jgi:hypothetical protein
MKLNIEELVMNNFLCGIGTAIAKWNTIGQTIFSVFILFGMLYAICAIGIVSHKYVLGIYDLEQRIHALENED